MNNRLKIHFILVAGFSSDDQEVWGLKNILKEHGYGATTVSFYGTEFRDDFTGIDEKECIDNLAKTIGRLAEKNEKVFGIGISLGGALLLEHAKKNSNLDGIISIGTPFRLRNKLVISFGRKILPVVYPFWKKLQRIKSLRLWPLGAAEMMFDFLEGSFLKNLGGISTPVLLLHSKKDGVTDFRALEEFLPEISSSKKEVVFFKNGNHVINYNPMIVETAINFFNLGDSKKDDPGSVFSLDGKERVLEFEKVEYK